MRLADAWPTHGRLQAAAGRGRAAHEATPPGGPAFSVDLDTTLFGAPLQIGSLRRISGPSGDVIAFAYDPGWLARPGAFVIDPSHGLYPGDQYPRQGQEISPIFTDSAPDRWGRTLLDRREALEAREEGRSRRGLGEWEYLLGVADVSRMGALRFRDDRGRYLDDVTPSMPPVARLRELEAAARELERPTRNLSSEAEQLALLLAPGGSLGGARPKASYLATDGDLWLAKFPSRNDNRDMAGCEWVLNELAARAGSTSRSTVSSPSVLSIRPSPHVASIAKATPAACMHRR